MTSETPIQEWRRGDFVISTDKTRVDVPAVTRWLAKESYWAQGIPQEMVERAIAGSDVFGMYRETDGEQIGFARIITDHATFAYLCDVFILPAYQGQHLGVWLMETIWSRPEMQELRRWSLATRDAHTLYERFGFETDTSGKWMSRRLRDSYLPSSESSATTEE